MTMTDDRPTSREDRRKSAWRPAALATIGVAVLVAVGLGVWATLSAIATGSQVVTSGTLKLTLANDGVGFSQGISLMAPGDVVNRYVDLTNGGTLDAQALTLKVAAVGDAALITDGTNTRALRISVNGCTTSWAETTGVCTGGSSVVLATTPLSGLSGPLALTPSTMAPGAVQHLQISVQLPDQTEVTINGTLPVPTIQGLTADLTYTFGETQRTATTTNS